MNRADRTAFETWKPSRRQGTAGRADAVDAARSLVIAAHPATLAQARGAAGYMYRLLIWEAQTDRDNTITSCEDGPTLRAEQVDAYLEHLSNTGAAKGTIDAARSYLIRCVTGGPGLNGHKRPPRETATAADVIASYQPDPARISEHRWERTGPATRNAVTAYDPADVKAAASAMHIVALHIAWAAAEHIPPDAYFDRATVDGFIAVGTQIWTTRTRNTYRAKLRAVARANNPNAWRPDPRGARSVVEPYTDIDVARIARAIADIPTRRSRSHLEAAYRLAVHAGIIGADASAIQPADITYGHPTLIAVRGDGTRTRTVPISEDGTDALAASCETAAELGEGWLLGGGPNRVDRAFAVWHRLRQDGIDVQPQRLRARWLCRLAATPIPLASMLEVAGLESADPVLNILPWVRPYPIHLAHNAIAEAPPASIITGGH